MECFIAIPSHPLSSVKINHPKINVLQASSWVGTPYKLDGTRQRPQRRTETLRSLNAHVQLGPDQGMRAEVGAEGGPRGLFSGRTQAENVIAVSYTHLTLPTIHSV